MIGKRITLGDTVGLQPHYSYLHINARGIVIGINRNSSGYSTLYEIAVPSPFWKSTINSRHKDNIIVASRVDIKEVY